MLGAGEPIRVKASQRVLFRIVNASATLHHRLALADHLFQVIALDGNAVPVPTRVPILDLGPGERVDAIVEMNRPGVWILGEVANRTTRVWHGCGRRVCRPGRCRSVAASWKFCLGLHNIRRSRRGARARRTTDDGVQSHGRRASLDDQRQVVPEDRSHRGPGEPDGYRWLLDNQSADAHPIHLHRHRFEIVRYAGQPVSGIWKDVVVVPAWKQVEVDVPTTQPGLSLFHCHQQFHMDMGFMTMMRYAE